MNEELDEGVREALQNHFVMVCFRKDFSILMGSIDGGVLLTEYMYNHKEALRCGLKEFSVTAEEIYRRTTIKAGKQRLLRATMRNAGILKERLKGAPARTYFELNVEKIGELILSGATI